MKAIVLTLIFTVFYLSNLLSQETDTTIVFKNLDEVVVNRFFQQNYNRELDRVRRIYPMALKAKAIIDEYEAELLKIEKKREAKKYSKKMVKFLKEEFTYSIRDLYTSEGRLLMQLVNRETGKTVNQIIAEYSGDWQAFIYRNLAKMFDQDLGVKYDPERSNYYTEIVIADILSGKVEFDSHMDTMTKEAFKVSQKQYKSDLKKTRQRGRIEKKEQKQLKKALKKTTKEKAN